MIDAFEPMFTYRTAAGLMPRRVVLAAWLCSVVLPKLLKASEVEHDRQRDTGWYPEDLLDEWAEKAWQ